ncbi:MAG TPA: hypothetical protein VD948_07110 [Rhodothermales bacterium]|nr:hypothetical protein [Rhodothermales bacterium]
MGKSAILALVAFLVIGAARQTQQTQTTLATEGRTAETRYDMLARNAALYGTERAKQGLMRSFSSTTYTGTLDQANYTTTVTVSGNVATIRSRGFTTDQSGQTRSYGVVDQIQGQVKMNAPTQLPGFLRHSLLVDGDFSLNGNITIDTFRVPGQTFRSSASIHTNGSLTSSGNSALVKGFGYYVTTQSANTNLFKPYNPNGDPVLQKASVLEIPENFANTVNTAAKYADRTTVGALLLNGTYDFTALGATRDDPYVWYVNGPIAVAGSATLKGYVMFITTQNITLSGSVTSTLAGGYAESNAAWYTAGNISLSGSTNLWGQFYAAGDVSIQGSVNVYGNIVTGGAFSIGGSPKVYTIPASPALAGIFEFSPMRRISYSEGW